jgi:hypothetical protein
MIKLVLSFFLLALCSSQASAFDPKDLDNLKFTGNCKKCDLSDVVLDGRKGGASIKDLSNGDLSYSRWSNNNKCRYKRCKFYKF